MAQLLLMDDDPEIVSDVERILRAAGHHVIAVPNGTAAEPRDPEPHASARWARVLMPIIDSPTDPRTIERWSRLAFVSPGALRNWCRMAGLSPRRSLLFGRLLRVVLLNQGGQHRPENLLDVADRRTLASLLTLAGLNHEIPSDVDTFLRRQRLVQDPDAMDAIRRALATHQPPVGARPQARPQVVTG